PDLALGVLLAPLVHLDGEVSRDVGRHRAACGRGGATARARDSGRADHRRRDGDEARAAAGCCDQALRRPKIAWTIRMTMIAPITENSQLCQDQNSSKLMSKSRPPSQPPSMAPSTPRSRVSQNPPGCLPGRMMRAMTPAISPRM